MNKLKPNPSIAFMICSEKGELEKKSVLFAKSLRKFGGKLRNSPIYSLSPRKGKNISNATQKAFAELNVIHQHNNLNEEYENYHFANKIAACTFFEEQLSENILIFCDSDQLVLGDLSEFILKDDEDSAFQHVAIKGIGSNGKDQNADYWNKLYTLTGVDKRRYIQLNEKETIFEYYNAGLIVAKRKLGLFRQWKKNFDAVMQNNLQPLKGIFFLEQSVLSATLTAMSLSIKTLPTVYNFHFLKGKQAEEIFHQVKANEIKILHYHQTLDAPQRFKIPHAEKNGTLKWIQKELKHLGINDQLFFTDLELTFDLKKNELRSLFNQ